MGPFSILRAQKVNGGLILLNGRETTHGRQETVVVFIIIDFRNLTDHNRPGIFPGIKRVINTRLLKNAFPGGE
jgi:hypothetical protein